MELFFKYALLVYFVLFFLASMVLPTYRVWKSTGVDPHKLGNSNSAHDYIGKRFRVTLIVEHASDAADS